MVLRISGLTKSFRGRRVVDNVDMTVRKGQIVGFLGPNGAGKTSIMTMVLGLQRPDAGKIELFGQANLSTSTRLRVGYLQERPSLYPEMTARAYLSLFARLHGVPKVAERVETVLDRVGLTSAADRVVGSYSRGMQQRTSLARVMLHEPEFLILDEPTLGLDPRGVADMRDIFRDMRDAGTTLLFSSHQLAEIERICDAVIFLSEGRVIAAGSPAELLPETARTEGLVVELAEPADQALSRLAGHAGIADVQATGLQTLIVRLTDPPGALQDRRIALAGLLISAGLTPLSIGTGQPTLEDLFLTLAGPRPANGD
jgi:ABC-2 type transport system ATP-binding protein